MILITIVEMDRTSRTAPLQLVKSFNAVKQEHVSLTTGSVMAKVTVQTSRTNKAVETLELVTAASFSARPLETVFQVTGSVMVMTTVTIIQTSMTAQPISSVDATSLDANPVWLRRVYLVTGLVMEWMIVVMGRTSLTVPLGNVR